jgi:hypothetical protein
MQMVVPHVHQIAIILEVFLDCEADKKDPRMKINIKDLYVEMEVKNKGVEFEVRDNQGNQLGDLYVAKAGLDWCKGKTTRENGIRVSWEDFIDFMNDQ